MRFEASKQNMKRGYWKVVDNATGEAIQSGLTIKSVAESIAKDLNDKREGDIEGEVKVG